MRLAPSLVWLLAPAAAFACKCVTSYPVCDAVAAADYVFIGKVESIEPVFPDPWRPGAEDTPAEEIARLQQERSPENLNRLRDLYLRLFPDLTGENADLDQQLRNAVTYEDLERAFNAIAARGKRVHFSVSSVYKSGKDKDDDANGSHANPADDEDNTKPAPTTLDVWTDSGDCGFHFQKGETYLVYADDDEETSRLETSGCTRTKRLSDAGSDLAYLYFLHRGGDSTRLEGFVTSDSHQDPGQFPDHVESPAPGLVIELKARGAPEYARSDSDGRFVFDGLNAGEYEISVYDGAFPGAVNLLSGPRALRVKASSCASSVIAVPAPKPSAH